MEGDSSNAARAPRPFMGVKARRGASFRRDVKGDYLDVPSDPFLSGVLSKRGDETLVFADKIMRCTGSGKMKRGVLMITDSAIYLADADSDMLKRRIMLAAVDKICLSKLSDNFFAIIVPDEYDCLMASTRKTEIVTVLVEASKSKSDYEIGVVFSNRFQYRAAADIVKEVRSEETQGGIKTRIMKKHR